MDTPCGYNLFVEYVDEIKSKNRFFPDEKFIRLFDKIISDNANIEIVPKEKILYRARLNPLNNEFEYISELGINKNNPSHNRASPIGISYLYLADEPNTAIAEIRANTNEYATIATWTTTRELKLIKLTNSSSAGCTIGEEFDSMDVSGFIFFLSHSFALPVQERAEPHYLPDQIFAEYCKKKGFDGIKYISSARGYRGYGADIHYNYVLFNENSVMFKQADKYKVKKIIYEIEHCSEVILKDESGK